MKTLMNLAAICLCVALFGCESSQSTTAPANMGAVGECSSDCSSSCCGSCDKASMGAVGDKDCASSCDKASMGAVSEKDCASSCDKASMGAVSEKDCASSCEKSSCDKASMGVMSDAPSCETKSSSDCGSVCPMSGKTSDTSLGAMSDSKADGCCKSKSSCGTM